MTETELADRDCLPCTPDRDPLAGDALLALYEHLDADVWEFVDDHHLRGTVEFAEFRDAFEFAKAVGELAEAEWHHPEIHLSWGEVVVEQWTYAIDGLFETDFVVAARVDRLSDQHAPDSCRSG